MIPRRDLVAVVLIILAVTGALVAVAGLAWLIIPRKMDTVFAWGADMIFALVTFAVVVVAAAVLWTLR